MKLKNPTEIKKLKHFNSAAMPPIYQQSTVLFDSLEQLEESEYNYGRQGTETNRVLEEKLARLENAKKCFVTQSGASAIFLSLLSVLEKGDHIVMVDTVYAPAKNFYHHHLKKMAIDISFVPGDVGEEINQYLQKNTKVIFLESPSSIFYEIQDIDPIVKVAKNHGIITIMDNTYGAAGFFKPLDYGIDISLFSVSKYSGGHADIVMGGICANDESILKKIQTSFRIFGYHTSPFDCFLAYRGLETTKIRFNKSAALALEIAKFLEKCPEIEKVIYPELKSFNQHERFKKYFKKANGLITFIFKPDYSLKQQREFVNRLNCFGIGYSWGGCESVVMIYSGQFSRPKEFDESHSFIRIGVGLDKVRTLKADIKNALQKCTH